MPQDELAANVTLEQGKTLADAHGDVFRGLGRFLSDSARFTYVWSEKLAPAYEYLQRWWSMLAGLQATSRANMWRMCPLAWTPTA